VLRGGPGYDGLTGGAGRDRLSGGRSGDELIGDGRGVAAAADVLDGGRGRDSASWVGRRHPVRIDLRSRRPQGSPGEGDRLSGIEDVAGGAGPDVLVGTSTSNTILGGRGPDRLSGRGGNDVLDAGNAIRRGTFVERDRAVDRVACGEGLDLVTDGYHEVFPRSCELLDFNEVDVLEAGRQVLQPRPYRGRLLFHATDCVCAATAYRRVRVFAGGREIGRSRYVKMPDGARWIPVRMRRPLPRRGVVRVVITGVDPVGDDSGDRLVYEPFRFSYRLRR
jgi:hypothetical protein